MSHSIGIRGGNYPVMITPYTKDNKINETAMRQLTRWYDRKGCHGIFASCQSSEIFYLSLQERIRLVELVTQEAAAIARETGRERMSVVASGHISDSPEAQAEELIMTHEAGADAVVLITNRFDIGNTGDAAWVRDFESLLNRLPKEMQLGLYECPYPYKRLLSEDMLKAVRDSGRCVFIKDTCCDPEILKKRLELLEGSGVGLFNANTQTALHTLKLGAKGICGIVSNFHPEFYVWLYENYEKYPEKAEKVQNLLSMLSFTGSWKYPLSAKYYLKEFEKIEMEVTTRRPDVAPMNAYDKFVMKQLHEVSQDIRKILEET